MRTVAVVLAAGSGQRFGGGLPKQLRTLAGRTLVDQQTIEACVRALATDRAVGVTVPSSDTIVEAADGVITRMPRRDMLLRCQTPQGFRLSVIAAAYRLAAADPGFAEA